MSETSPGFAFAAIGLDHDHIYGQTEAMLGAGCRLVAYQTGVDADAERYGRRYPQARRVEDEREILEDPDVRLVLGAGICSERAPMAIRAMRHGKDVMLDKPGATTLDQLAELRRVQAETGRIVSICFSEHYLQRAAVEAGRLVQAGAIGRVIQTSALGPHRLRKAARPPWFFARAQYGGILCDIGAHQAEQFLFYTGSTEAEVVASQVGNFANPDTPELEDFGDMLLRSPTATGYARLDWFTPDGLETWGDGRYTILGTEGYIELRKYIDIAGRPGGDHLFLVDRKDTRYIDCSTTPLSYATALRDDVIDRTASAMPQAHGFLAMQLALEAQAQATRIGGQCR